MTDGRTEDGKWKIEQCSVRPETAIRIIAKYDVNPGSSAPELATSVIGVFVAQVSSLKNNFKQKIVHCLLKEPLQNVCLFSACLQNRRKKKR